MHMLSNQMTILTKNQLFTTASCSFQSVKPANFISCAIVYRYRMQSLVQKASNSMEKPEIKSFLKNWGERKSNNSPGSSS